MSEATPSLLVACLCAEWCGSCRDYRATFAALAAQFSGRAEFAFIDVEDDADALGDPDIENFPTLLIADAQGLRFLGPVTPQAQTAERLVREALDGQLTQAGDEVLAERVRALVRERSGGVAGA
jgi:thiol-disulfide isomerase/thioredoxin